jgi:hypothetical protein
MIRCQASVCKSQVLFRAARDARIVDQHIELAKMTGGGGHDGGPVLLFGNIERLEPRRGTMLLATCRPSCSSTSAITTLAPTREYACRGCPHAGYGAGDDGDFARESHCDPPFALNCGCSAAGEVSRNPDGRGGSALANIRGERRGRA